MQQEATYIACVFTKTNCRVFQCLNDKKILNISNEAPASISHTNALYHFPDGELLEMSNFCL